MRQRFSNRHRTQAAGALDVFFLQPRKQEEGLEILGKAGAHAGPHHLDGNLALGAVGIAHPCRMDLGDGGGGDGVVDAGEELRNGDAERILDAGEAVRIGKRFHPVLQMGEFKRHVETDDVGTRGEELAEFGVGRTQPRDGRRHALGVPLALAALAGKPGGQAVRGQRGT